MKRKLFIICASGILLTVLVGAWLAGNVLTAPAHQSIGNVPPDLVGRSVEFPSESGATIHGWFIPGKKGTGAIVLMHGVRANRLSMVDRARFLSHAGYSVLLFDFQAHGESTGEHITFGYLESRDAQAAISFLHANAPNEKIGVIGISMGGAATLLASPPLDVKASAGTPLLTWQLKPRLGIDTEVLRPIDHVERISAPKLFIVGAEDQHTTLEESHQMFNAASEPKELWVVDGARHVDLYPVTKEAYERRVLDFFRRHRDKQ